MEIKNKVIVATGSAGGLGFAMLQELGLQGAQVIVSDLGEEAVEAAVQKLRSQDIQASGHVCDVTDEASVEALFSDVRRDFGRVDVAIANAGILRDGLLVKVDRETGRVKHKMSLADFEAVIRVNLTGVFLTVREAAASMIEGKTPGVIIPISSIARHGFRGQSNYSAAKAGVAAMTRLWAEELGRYRIRVVGIAPGFIATKMVLSQMDQRAREKWESQIPIGRLGEPEEVAHTARFLIENELMNGVIVEPSGGVKT